MLHYSLPLLCALSIFIVPNAADMTCNLGGIPISCPTFADTLDKSFCCDSNSDIQLQYCCNFEDYAKQNSGVFAGIVIAILVIITMITICCCCFCSCCYLAQRRIQGQVLYVPTTGGQVASISTPAYQQIHPPPPTQAYNPNSQLPLNPYYK